MNKVVLYSLWNKKLKKVYGDIEDRPGIPGTIEHFTQEPCCNFYERKINGKYDRKTVSPFEGVVYNKCVWFYEENDELAITKFIEYENNCISTLQKRIVSHTEIIDSLKKEIKHE